MSRKGENITKRKDGRWEARVIKGYDLNGKAQYQYLYGKTYAQARRKKEEFIREDAANRKQPYTGQILFSAVAKDYLLHIQNGMKETSYVRYEAVIEQHLLPFFGKRKMGDLSTSLIDEFSIWKKQHGRLHDNGALGAKRLCDILSVLRQIIRFSESRGCRMEQLRISRPKTENVHAATLSCEEEETLISYLLAQREPSCFGVVIALYTGVRIGELCALRWGDVHFESKTLYVNKTLLRIKDRAMGESKTKILITAPKTPTSQREIPIPAFLMHYFYLYRQMAQDPDGYVLTGTQKYIEPSNYYVRYQTWLSRCGVRHYSFHALRHTFATRCIENGFDAKALSEVLGHSDVRVTLSRYVHPTMEYKRTNMDRLADVLSSQIFRQS